MSNSRIPVLLDILLSVSLPKFQPSAGAVHSCSVSHCLDKPYALALSAAALRAREHYDALAFLYRLFWGEHLHHGLFRTGAESPRQAQVELLRYCASLVAIQPGCRVLDVGCGYGATSMYLAQRYGCRCTGLTVSPTQALYAQRQSQRTGVDGLVQFVLCDAEAHPLGSRCYDLAWIMEATEHFGNRAQFFENVAGALRDGGRLLLTCWVAAARTPEMRCLAELCACQEFQTIETYLGQISAPGLRVRHIEELTQSVAPTWDFARTRTLALMPTLPLWPTVIRNFARAIRGLRSAFHSRKLQHWVVVASK